MSKELPIRGADSSVPNQQTATTSADQAEVAKMDAHNISARGKGNGKLGGRMRALVEVLDNMYDKEQNPNGTISLGVAENSLMHNELSNYYTQKVKVTPHTLTYAEGPFGNRILQEALANLINTRFSPPPISPVKRSQTIVLAGVSSTIDALGFALADEGEAFLLSRPLYTGFKGDLELRNKIKLVPVSLQGLDPLAPETVERYEVELERQKTLGVKVKGIIMCNPHNPIGRAYSKEAIIAYMKFCAKHNIHYISDEVYAFSQFSSKHSPNPVPFISALSISLDGVIPAHLVHVLYGTSKDLGSNGLRVGAIISQHNDSALLAAGSVGIFGWSSNLSQLAVATLLNDKPFLDWYLAENSKRLGESYDFLVGWLAERKIPHLKGGSAGFFLWTDLSQFFPASVRSSSASASASASSTSESQPHRDDSSAHAVANPSPALKAAHDNLYAEIMQAGVYLGNSESFFAEQYGWFRITFSVQREILLLALGRLDDAFRKAREKDLQGNEGNEGKESKVQDPAEDLPVE